MTVIYENLSEVGTALCNYNCREWVAICVIKENLFCVFVSDKQAPNYQFYVLSQSYLWITGISELYKLFSQFSP